MLRKPSLVRKPGDRPAESAVNAILNLHADLAAIPILDGKLVTDVAMDFGLVTVRHGLGRKPVGAILVYHDVFFPDYGIDSWDATVVVFNSDATFTASFWFF